MCVSSKIIFSQPKPPLIRHDKLVVKVAKMKTSNVIAILNEHCPSHVSKDAEIGKEECLKFFPSGYVNGSETGEPILVPEDISLKKRKKRRKSRMHLDEMNEEQSKSENKDVGNQLEKESEAGDGEEGDADEDDDEDETDGVIEEDDEDNEDGGVADNGE